MIQLQQQHNVTHFPRWSTTSSFNTPTHTKVKSIWIKILNQQMNWPRRPAVKGVLLVDAKIAVVSWHAPTLSGLLVCSLPLLPGLALTNFWMVNAHVVNRTRNVDINKEGGNATNQDYSPSHHRDRVITWSHSRNNYNTT
jgi:hypothetical protein